jgi:hypothetical protein
VSRPTVRPAARSSGHRPAAGSEVLDDSDYDMNCSDGDDDGAVAGTWWDHVMACDVEVIPGMSAYEYTMRRKHDQTAATLTYLNASITTATRYLIEQRDRELKTPMTLLDEIVVFRKDDTTHIMKLQQSLPFLLDSDQMLKAQRTFTESELGVNQAGMLAGRDFWNLPTLLLHTNAKKHPHFFSNNRSNHIQAVKSMLAITLHLQKALTFSEEGCNDDILSILGLGGGVDFDFEESAWWTQLASTGNGTDETEPLDMLYTVTADQLIDLDGQLHEFCMRAAELQNGYLAARHELEGSSVRYHLKCDPNNVLPVLENFAVSGTRFTHLSVDARSETVILLSTPRIQHAFELNVTRALLAVRDFVNSITFTHHLAVSKDSKVHHISVRSVLQSGAGIKEILDLTHNGRRIPRALLRMPSLVDGTEGYTTEQAVQKLCQRRQAHLAAASHKMNRDTNELGVATSSSYRDRVLDPNGKITAPPRPAFPRKRGGQQDSTTHFVEHTLAIAERHRLVKSGTKIHAPMHTFERPVGGGLSRQTRTCPLIREALLGPFEFNPVLEEAADMPLMDRKAEFDMRWASRYVRGGYQELCSVKQFLEATASTMPPDKNPLRAGAGVLNQAAEAIQMDRSAKLPTLETDDNRRDFVDGFVNTHIDKETQLAKGLIANPWVSQKHFDMQLREQNRHSEGSYGMDRSQRDTSTKFEHTRRAPVHSYAEKMACGRIGGEHTRTADSIEAPHFRSLFECQIKSEVVRTYSYGMFSRLTHRVKEVDDYEVILQILGIAQSGKTTAASVAEQFFSPHDRAIISSNMEPLFGLMACIGKRLAVCRELTKQCALRKSDLQCAASGEPMSIAVKNEEVFKFNWDVMILLVGNESGPWQDAAGSMLRRLFTIMFRIAILATNTFMDRELKKEMGSILLLTHYSFLGVLQRHAGTSIWKEEVLPKYFLLVSRDQAHSSNRMCCHLDSKLFTLTPGKSISWQELVKVIQHFEKHGDEDEHNQAAAARMGAREVAEGKAADDESVSAPRAVDPADRLTLDQCREHYVEAAARVMGLKYVDGRVQGISETSKHIRRCHEAALVFLGEPDNLDGMTEVQLENVEYPQWTFDTNMHFHKGTFDCVLDNLYKVYTRALVKMPPIAIGINAVVDEIVNSTGCHERAAQFLHPLALDTVTRKQLEAELEQNPEGFMDRIFTKRRLFLRDFEVARNKVKPSAEKEFAARQKDVEERSKVAFAARFAHAALHVNEVWQDLSVSKTLKREEIKLLPRGPFIMEPSPIPDWPDNLAAHAPAQTNAGYIFMDKLRSEWMTEAALVM